MWLGCRTTVCTEPWGKRSLNLRWNGWSGVPRLTLSRKWWFSRQSYIVNSHGENDYFLCQDFLHTICTPEFLREHRDYVKKCKKERKSWHFTWRQGLIKLFGTGPLMQWFRIRQGRWRSKLLLHWGHGPWLRFFFAVARVCHVNIQGTREPHQSGAVVPTVRKTNTNC